MLSCHVTCFQDAQNGGRRVVDEGALENILKRDRLIVLADLGGVIAVAWIYLFAFDGGMPAAMQASAPWTLSHFLLMLAMWGVMMIGMMLPSAAPMMLL
jgi:predicted metal-binding membrane protein